MMPGEYGHYKEMQTSLAPCPNLRLYEDESLELDSFIYSYLETNVLQASRKLDKDTKKILLKRALTGLAAMHKHNVVHTGVYTFGFFVCHSSLYFYFSMIVKYQPRSPTYRSQV